MGSATPLRMKTGSLVTSDRVSAVAAIVLAVAAVSIPAILDVQQQESLAKNSTVEHYRSLFGSPQGRLLDKITTEAEIFFWKELPVLRKRNEELPEDQRKSDGQMYREADKTWLVQLRNQYGEPKLRVLAVFLLKTADLVYECARFRDLFEDIESDGQVFKWGAVKLDRSAPLAHTQRNYLYILYNFVRGFFGPRPTAPRCHRESIVNAFGRRFSESFWYLRRLLYCDKFLANNYFRDPHSDSSPLYRLESIAMVTEQTDLEFRFPNEKYAVMRTLSQSHAYRKDHENTIAYNFRLEVCD